MKRDFVQTYRSSVVHALEMYESGKANGCTDLLSNEAKNNPESLQILSDVASTQGCYQNDCEACPFHDGNTAKRALVALDEIIKIQKLLGTE